MSLRRMRAWARGAKSPSRALGRRSSQIQDWPELAPTTCSSLAVSRPMRSARAKASAAAARLMPASRLLISLARAASPSRSPTWNIREARASSSGRSCSRISLLQATIMLMLPVRAREGPPEIGASMSCVPRSAMATPNRSTSAGPIVLQIVIRLCASSEASRPPAPNSTVSICAASTTTMRIRSQAAPIAAALSWTVAPASAARLAAARSISRTWTMYPLASRLRAMPPPMFPAPMMPTPLRGAIIFRRTVRGRCSCRPTRACRARCPASRSRQACGWRWAIRW